MPPSTSVAEFQAAAQRLEIRRQMCWAACYEQTRLLDGRTAQLNCWRASSTGLPGARSLSLSCNGVARNSCPSSHSRTVPRTASTRRQTIPYPCMIHTVYTGHNRDYSIAACLIPRSCYSCLGELLWYEPSYPCCATCLEGQIYLQCRPSV